MHLHVIAIGNRTYRFSQERSSISGLPKIMQFQRDGNWIDVRNDTRRQQIAKIADDMGKCNVRI